MACDVLSPLFVHLVDVSFVRRDIGFDLVLMLVVVADGVVHLGDVQRGVLHQDLLRRLAGFDQDGDVLTRIRVPSITAWPPHTPGVFVICAEATILGAVAMTSSILPLPGNRACPAAPAAPRPTGSRPSPSE